MSGGQLILSVSFFQCHLSIREQFVCVCGSNSDSGICFWTQDTFLLRYSMINDI